MRALFHPVTLALASAVAMASAPALAQTTELPRVEVIGARAALNAAQVVLDASSFQSTYGMSTGRRMTVASHGSALKVRYGARPAVTLRHDGLGSFSSPDGALALRFQLDEGGEPSQVRLSVPAGWL